MNVVRYSVSLDPELVARIDEVAGSRGRSAFLARAAEAALASNGLPRPVAPITSPDGPRRAADDLHGDAGAGGWRPGDPIPDDRRLKLEEISAHAAAKRKKAMSFDPSRFNQAKRLR